MKRSKLWHSIVLLSGLWQQLLRDVIALQDPRFPIAILLQIPFRRTIIHQLHLTKVSFFTKPTFFANYKLFYSASLFTQYGS